MRVDDDWWETVLPNTQELMELQAEYHLLIAIIQRAIIDHLSPDTPLYIRAEVGRWLFDDERQFMSLWHICDMLSDDPQYLRSRIRWAAKNTVFSKNTIIFRVDR
jgi:hypothetical protein